MSADTLTAFERWRRWMLWLGVAVVVAFVLWFRTRFEFVTVPNGMDTLPRTHPPGAVCLVVKRPGSLASGDVVFVDLPEGGTLLARVVAVEPDGGVVVAADNEHSKLTGGKRIGPLPASAARGRVATVLGGEPDPQAKGTVR